MQHYIHTCILVNTGTAVPTEIKMNIYYYIQILNTRRVHVLVPVVRVVLYYRYVPVTLPVQITNLFYPFLKCTCLTIASFLSFTCYSNVHVPSTCTTCSTSTSSTSTTVLVHPVHSLKFIEIIAVVDQTRCTWTFPSIGVTHVWFCKPIFMPTSFSFFFFFLFSNQIKLFNFHQCVGGVPGHARDDGVRRGCHFNDKIRTPAHRVVHGTSASFVDQHTATVRWMSPGLTTSTATNAGGVASTAGRAVGIGTRTLVPARLTPGEPYRTGSIGRGHGPCATPAV